MDIIAAHVSAEDTFEGVLRQVPGSAWDSPSRCPGWTIRDVTGHVVWGRRVVVASARGEQGQDTDGGPGTEHPAGVLGEEPLTAWLNARAEADALLSAASLARPAPEFIRRIAPEATLGQVLDNLSADLLGHAWDIGSVIGVETHVDPDALRRVQRGIDRGLPRIEGFYADAPEPNPDATAFDRFLATTGRQG